MQLKSLALPILLIASFIWWDSDTPEDRAQYALAALAQKDIATLEKALCSKHLSAVQSEISWLNAQGVLMSFKDLTFTKSAEVETLAAVRAIGTIEVATAHETTTYPMDKNISLRKEDNKWIVCDGLIFDDLPSIIRTPEETIELAFKTVFSGNIAAVEDLVCTSVQPDARQLAAAYSGVAVEISLNQTTYKTDRIDNNHLQVVMDTTVIINNKKEKVSHTIKMVREDGRWKVCEGFI